MAIFNSYLQGMAQRAHSFRRTLATLLQKKVKRWRWLRKYGAMRAAVWRSNWMPKARCPRNVWPNRGSLGPWERHLFPGTTC